MVINTFITYDPDIDRLIDGDFFRLIQERMMTKSTLLSHRRVETLRPAIQRLAAAHKGFVDSGEPDVVPIPLAVLSLTEFPAEVDGKHQAIPIEVLFETEPLSVAPPEYLALTQLICLVAEERTLKAVADMSSINSHMFGTQVFGLIGTAHHSAMTLSRGRGSCLQAEYLTPEGKFNDLYFLTTADEVQASVMRQNQQADLVNGFLLLSRFGPQQADSFADYMIMAVEAYRRGDEVPSRLRDLIARSAGVLRDTTRHGHLPRARCCAELASALVPGSNS